MHDEDSKTNSWGTFCQISFLDLATYVGKFVVNLADSIEPLKKLLKSQEAFVWGREQNEAF